MAGSGAALDREGRNALINAAIDRDAAAVGHWLAAGVDPDLADRAGRRALHFAVRNNDPAIAAQLLDAGADPAVVDRNGNSVLADAVFASRGDGGCITLLLAAGADPDQANAHGVSPRSLAETIANYDVRRFFAERGG